MAPGAATDLSAIRFMRDCLPAFEEDPAQATDGTALVDAMTHRYPDAGMGIALQIGQGCQGRESSG